MPPRTAGTPAAATAISTAGWRAADLDGADVPVSPADGPRQDSGVLASGFTDTPAGAVLAAVNIAVRVSGQLGPAIFTPTITRQVTGTGAGALLAAAQQDYAQDSAQHPPAAPDGPAGTADADAVAFKVASWDPAAATVDVVAATASAQRAAVALQVRWLGGDWRLVAPPGGDLAVSAAPIPSTPGYTLLPGGGRHV